MSENIEKVLAALDGFRMSDEMTYSAYSVLYDEISLLDDLLEAQEPRVLTPDEVKASIGEPIYFESHGTYMGKTGFWILPALFTTHGLMRYVHPQSSHYSELGLHDYGKVWRCWSARPTDEQREATPWQS